MRMTADRQEIHHRPSAAGVCVGKCDLGRCAGFSSVVGMWRWVSYAI